MPVTNAGGFPVDGVPSAGVRGTVPGAWWYHSVTEEIRNTIVKFGGTPDFTRLDQLANAIIASKLTLRMSIKDHGAAGDGITDDTAAFAQAAAMGGAWFIPDGVYMIDTWIISRPIDVEMSACAVLRMRRLLPLNAGDVQAVVRVTAGGAGSMLDGLTLDGNRAAIGQHFVIDSVVMGLRTEDADSLVIRNIRVRNAICHGAYVFGGNEVVIDGIYAQACAQAVVIDSLNGGNIRGLVGKDISNAGFPVYQHAYELRNLNNTFVDGVTVDGHAPDAAGRDGGDIGVDITRMYNNTTIRNLCLSGYNPASGRTGLGVSVTGGGNFQLDRASVSGYNMGVDLLGVRGAGVSKVFVDCQWRPRGYFGLRIEGSGAYQQNSASGDLRANSDSVGVALSDVRVCRAIDGIVTDGRLLRFDSVETYGHSEYGLVLRADQGNPVQFPGSPRLTPEDIDLSGVSCYSNGSDGVFVSDALRVTFGSARIFNNGQDTTATTRNGFTFWSTHAGAVAEKVELTRGVNIYDNQNWTLVSGGSFVPGPSDSANHKLIYCVNASELALNQRIQLRKAAGADVTARVVDINLDDVTVETSGPVTYQEAGNLVAVAGTVTTAGIYMTGTGTDFISAFAGRSVVKIAGTWRTVVGVQSATRAVLDTALPADLKTQTVIQRIAIDVAAIASQQYGVQISDNARDVLIDLAAMPVQASGQFFNIAQDQYGNLRPGSRLKLRAAKVSVAGYYANLALANVPAGYRVIALRMDVDTAISGGGVTGFTAEMQVGGSTVETYATGLPLAQGTAINSAVYGVPLAASGSVVIVVEGGVASSGAVTTEIVIERVGVQ